MPSNPLYNEILVYHNANPMHKFSLIEPDIELEGINPSCGDDIILRLKLQGNTIIDCAFTGDGCAISQASTDIMIEMIKGKTKEEALHLCEVFLRMIKGEVSEEELEELEEASALHDIRHMPARVKCAVLAWHTLEEALSKSN